MNVPKYLLLVMLMIFCSSVLALEINEVMYNPIISMGDDSDLEWIEIYNNGTEKIDLTNFTINTRDFDDVVIFPNQYLVIARELIDGNDKDNGSFEGYYGNGDGVWNFSDDNFSVIDAGAFNLGNSGDTIILSDGIMEIILSYLDDLGADGNGNTLCLFNNTWQECLPTPGSDNVAVSDEEMLEKKENIILSTYLDESIYSNNGYTNLFKINIENKNCSEKDTVTVKYNITNGKLVKEDFFTKEIGCSNTASTGELLLEESGNYTLCGNVINSTVNETNFNDNSACMDFKVIDPYLISCDISLKIEMNETIIYNKGDPIKFKHTLNNDSFPYVIEYWVGDLFGNIVKDKFNSTNINTKSWKTNIYEEDRVLFIKSLIHPNCNDSNRSNNFAEKMFIVVDNWVDNQIFSSKESANSEINITKVTPSEISFGELIKVELEIYKNTTNKYSLSAWVERDGKSISEKTKINLKNKDMEYKVTLPIQLEPNCDGKIPDGESHIMVEGLDEEVKEKITIAGINSKLCKTSEQSDASKTNSKLSYDVEVPSTINPGERFTIEVKIANEDKEHDLEVWAYLYRGSKCYSCSKGERDGKLELITIKENKEKEIKLFVQADQDIQEGEYNLKVKIRKDNQKTTKDFTEKISVKVKEEKASSEESIAYFADSPQQELQGSEKEKVFHKGKGIVVYESSSEKAKKLIPSLLAATFGLLSLSLVFRRK